MFVFLIILLVLQGLGIFYKITYVISSFIEDKVNSLTKYCLFTCVFSILFEIGFAIALGYFL